VLVVQAQHNLSDARMEFMIRDRLSWMRFFGFDLGIPLQQVATLVFGYKSHISIDRRFGFIRMATATSAADSN